MYFQYPNFLFGLFALLIPLAIHLFNFRRHKKIMFSNVSLLKQITLESKKQRNLLHLIVLLLRMLAMALLVIALAKPVFNPEGNQQFNPNENKVIYIDNSFSMISEGNRGRLFNNAIHDAEKLINATQEDQRFIIRNNESQGRSLKNLTRDEAALMLSELQISPSSLQLSDVVMPLLSQSDQQQLMVFSDFQKNTANINNLPADSNLSYYFFPLQGIRYNNLTVDSLWFSDPLLIPGKSSTCWIRVSNMANSNYEKIPISLSINGQQKAVAGIDIPANTSMNISMTYNPESAGWKYGEVKIEDYPVTFDDNLFFTVQVVNHVNILAISDDGKATSLGHLFDSDSLFSFHVEDSRSINYNKFNQYNLIILNGLSELTSGLTEQIIQFLNQGGHVVLFSGNNQAEATLLNKTGSGRIALLDTAETRVSGIKLNHPLFKTSIEKIPDNANLPILHKHTRYVFPVKSGVESLITLLNGDDLLSQKKVGKGRLYLVSSGLEKAYSTLSSNILFVPMMAGIASLSGTPEKCFYTIGADDQLRLKTENLKQSEQPFTMQRVGAEDAFIPEQNFQNGILKLSLHGNVQTSGFYNLVLNDSLFSAMAFNYSRSESDLSCYSIGQIDSLCKQAKLPSYQIIELDDINYPEVINALQKERPIWKLFIIFALLALLAEGLLLRWRK